jgi:hypothetical protein
MTATCSLCKMPAWRHRDLWTRTDGGVDGGPACTCGNTEVDVYRDAWQAVQAENARLTSALERTEAALVEQTGTQFAAEDSIAKLAAALEGLSDCTLTQGHPEFGIECTVVKNGYDATVINQPSPIAAILNARAALDALTRPTEGAKK